MAATDSVPHWLIALARDYTVEQEMGRVLAGLDDVAHYITRIDSPVEVRPETLAAMGPNIAAAAQLLLNPDDVDVVAYGCTSASAVLGPDAVSKAIRSVHPQAKVTNLSAQLVKPSRLSAFNAWAFSHLTRHR